MEPVIPVQIEHDKETRVVVFESICRSPLLVNRWNSYCDAAWDIKADTKVDSTGVTWHALEFIRSYLCGGQASSSSSDEDDGAASSVAPPPPPRSCAPVADSKPGRTLLGLPWIFGGSARVPLEPLSVVEEDPSYVLPSVLKSELWCSDLAFFSLLLTAKLFGLPLLVARLQDHIVKLLQGIDSLQDFRTYFRCSPTPPGIDLDRHPWQQLVASAEQLWSTYSEHCTCSKYQTCLLSTSRVDQLTNQSTEQSNQLLESDQLTYPSTDHLAIPSTDQLTNPSTDQLTNPSTEQSNQLTPFSSDQSDQLTHPSTEQSDQIFTPYRGQVILVDESSRLEPCRQCGVDLPFRPGHRHHCRKCGRLICGACCVRVLAERISNIVPAPQWAAQSVVNWLWDVSTTKVCFDCVPGIVIEAGMRLLPLTMHMWHRARLVSPLWYNAASEAFCQQRAQLLHAHGLDMAPTPLQRRMLWRNRHYFVGHADWMVQVARATDLDSPDAVAELLALLAATAQGRQLVACGRVHCSRRELDVDCCGRLQRVALWLALLQQWQSAEPVRRFAVSQLADAELLPVRELYTLLPLLVHLLRYQPPPTPAAVDPLLQLLVARALGDCATSHDVRYTLYWQLQLLHGQPSADEALVDRYAAYLAYFCAAVGRGRPDGLHEVVELEFSRQLAERFYRAAKRTQGASVDAAKEELCRSLSQFPCRDALLLTDPQLRIDRFLFDGVSVKESKVRPMVVPVLACGGEQTNFLFKLEDVRKDQIMLLLVELAASLFEASGVCSRPCGFADCSPSRAEQRADSSRQKSAALNSIGRRSSLPHVPCGDQQRCMRGFDLPPGQLESQTIYRVLPTHADAGFIQFVPFAKTLGELRKHNTSLPNWLREVQYVTQLDPAVTGVFIRSVAFWSVMSHLLGFGDRHYNNLMLTESGQLFHIDFGYIFGCDPKDALGVSVPRVRLTSEIVDFIGGVGTALYRHWEKLTVDIFLELRRHYALFQQALIMLAQTKFDAGATEYPPAFIAKHLNDVFMPFEPTERAVHQFRAVIAHSINSKMLPIFDASNDLGKEFQNLIWPTRRPQKAAASVPP